VHACASLGPVLRWLTSLPGSGSTSPTLNGQKPTRTCSASAPRSGHADREAHDRQDNSALMRQALEAVGVTVRQVNILDGGHFPPFPPAEPDPFIETVRWFDEHLDAGATAQ
jgi:hypothetical protein